MKQYRGYFVDHVIFNSTEDIDNFIKSEAVAAYKKAVRYFADHCNMAASTYADEKAENLVNNFGFTWEEVEAIEIETLESIA